MSFFRTLLVSGLALAVVAIGSTQAEAHMAFKKHMQKKYEGTSVSCNACHVKGKPKTERSEFGKLFFKEFKENKLTLSEEWNAKEKADRKEYETKIMVPAFDKALKKIKEKKNKEDEKYDDLIKAGKIDGIKWKPKK